MRIEFIERQRYRSLAVAVLFLVLLSLGGALSTYQFNGRHPAEWLVYVVSTVLCLFFWRRATAANETGQIEKVRRWALLIILLGAFLLLQRLVWTMLGPVALDPAQHLFRPSFVYWPFVYLAAFLLLPSHTAWRLNWSLGFVVLVLALTGMYRRSGLSVWGAEEISLVTWVLVGNPLFLLMLRVLPRYEDWLQVANDEMATLRAQNELQAKVADNEQRFNLVVDSLQVGVWDYRFDDKGRIQERWWSSRFWELLGYDPAEFPATKFSADILLGDRGDDIRRMLHTQLVDSGRSTFDVQMTTRTQGRRWFNVSAKAEFDDGGRVVRATGAIEDIHASRMAVLELKEAQEELITLAYRDALTGLHNRRAFDDQFQREWDRARRAGRPLSLLALDLDWFKAYNDHYGHPAGDECLRLVSAVISQSLRRPGDFGARIGGEEFLVLMPETDVAGALVVAQQLESALRGLSLPHRGSPLGLVTCSGGLAGTMVTSADGRDDLLVRADAALYASKRAGRARITVAEPLVPAETSSGRDAP